MKIGSIVECVDDRWHWMTDGSKKGDKCIVDGFLEGGNHVFLFLDGWDLRDSVGARVNYRADCFREIQFPPSIELEIQECLTRELIER